MPHLKAREGGSVGASIASSAGRGVAETAGFSPLIDAKAAGRMFGVPHTWLLAQARMGRIPHHRLGHYVRFNAEDLGRWLEETRSGPAPGERGRRFGA